MYDNPIAAPSTNIHEFAHLFPMMSTKQHADLVADIKANGLIHPIVTLDGKVLDGRNRLVACQEAGVEPRFAPLAEDVDPLTYVVSTNFARRHLSESQRALAAARIATHNVDRAEAAKLFRVTPGRVKHAEAVLSRGTPELIAFADGDHIPVGLAAKLAAMPEAQQRAAVILEPAYLRGAVKTQQRIKKNKSLERATKAASQQIGKAVYAVIYADPPWAFKVFSENGKDRSAENHYPTMTLEDIKALPIPAAKESILFLWATAAMLPQALETMTAWGFEYRSQFVWIKEKQGTGFWTRNRHELLLIGVRGHIPAPAPDERLDSVISLPAGEHSAKPDWVRDMIAEAFPTLPKIELFARQQSPGWASHGNEIDTEVIDEVEDEADAAD